MRTSSIFDAFLDHAVMEPLAEINLQPEQATISTTNWGMWRETDPDMIALVEGLALGRSFDFRNGRDAYGPIVPAGDVDSRLPVRKDIICVLAASGTPIACQRIAAFSCLRPVA